MENRCTRFREGVIAICCYGRHEVHLAACVREGQAPSTWRVRHGFRFALWTLHIRLFVNFGQDYVYTCYVDLHGV